MDFFTKAQFGKPKFKIKASDNILFMGSCFAEHISKKASCFGINTIYPFGALYNPLSIANNIQLILANCPINANDTFLDKGVYQHSNFHSKYGDLSKELAVSKMNNCIKSSYDFLQKADILVFSLGTIYIYRLISNGKVVANCHHTPQSEFKKEKISVSDVVDALETIIKKFDNKKILFTVSPVRHLKDTAHGNQISKSTLLLAVDELCSKYANCDYFGAYEIMLDELRDYRFYAEDMVHPSSVAVDYIWQRFLETYFEPSDIELLNKVAEVKRFYLHRPFNPESDEHKKNIILFNKKKEDLSNKYPFINWQNEQTI